MLKHTQCILAIRGKNFCAKNIIHHNYLGLRQKVIFTHGSPRLWPLLMVVFVVVFVIAQRQKKIGPFRTLEA
jgi:hypothetical protein